jgi:hypothetical protein
MTTITQARNKINAGIRDAVGGVGTITPVIHANVLDDTTNNDGVLQYIAHQTRETYTQFTPFPGLQAGWSQSGNGFYNIFRDRMISMNVRLTRTASTVENNLISNAVTTALRPSADIALPVSVMQVGGSGTVYTNGVLRLLADGNMRVIVPAYPNISLPSFDLTVFLNIFYLKI